MSQNYSAHIIIPLAVRAAREATDLRKQGLMVERKPDGSKVTNADIAASNIIVAGLRNFDGATKIISEEDKIEDTNGSYRNAWVIDPIDGTGSFIKGGLNWCVLIGYVENGAPLEGVAYYPELKTIYFTDGASAYKSSIHVSVDGQFELNVPVKLRTHESTSSFLRFGQFISDISHRFPQGSQKTTYSQPSNTFAVVEGVIDVAVNPPTMGDWDLAAPDAILRKAGGVFVSTTSGRPLEYGLPRAIDRVFLQDESIAGNTVTLERFHLISDTKSLKRLTC